MHILLNFPGYGSVGSSKPITNFLEVLNFNWEFLKLNQFICNYTK